MTGSVHPPKTETFALTAMTNTDPKGFVRAVEEYRHEPFGLYLARPTPGRAQFHYLESWLLPELGLRINDYWHRQGHECEWDYYLDVVAIEQGKHSWSACDLYLDLVLRTGKDLVVQDTDELLAATHAGLITPALAQRALETALRTVDAVARHGYDLDRWLTTLGITLTWRRC